ncbi:hypothetical protein SASPL_126139 [Salvia splendens]|uniref:Uncharacterized protein n=1 Tax=Salvia splendens TaxID=180675 RepID=A0A8X8XF25_SALSN|nr:hypothetical protein SASPL_126139 [Salvia splendens]
MPTGHLESSATTTSRRMNALFPAGILSDRMSTGLRATPSPLGISSLSRNGHSDSHIALAKARTRVGLRQNRTNSRFCMRKTRLAGICPPKRPVVVLERFALPRCQNIRHS